MDPQFERAVVVLACCRPRFYLTGVHKVDPDLLGVEAHKLLLNTVRGMVAENDSGPDSALLVLQRLRRQMAEGKVSYEQIVEAGEIIDAAIDAGLPEESQVLGELAPVLKRRIQHQAVIAATHEYATRGDFASVVELIGEAERVGVSEQVTTGSQLGMGSFAAIDKLRNLDRLTTGIIELDGKIDGGLHRGGLGVAIGGPGAGKSMFLSHVACQAWLLGMHVAYATLELPEPLVHARMIANVTGVSINDITAGGATMTEAVERLKQVNARGGLGELNVKEFTPHATTIEDLFLWEDLCEQQVGRAVDIMLVDYGDKLIAKPSGRDKGNHASDYVAMRVVYEGLRVHAVDKMRWCWTASQPRRNATSDGKKRTTKVDLDDVAESMHKVRVPDLVITLNPNDEEKTLEYFVAKNRVGEGRQVAGPVPTDFASGRMCPL